MKIFFIRHGETTGDVEDRFGGAYDDHLSGKGTEQSEALGTQLAGSGIAHIYASPLVRAQETAGILSMHISTNVPPVQKADGLEERNQYGHLSGMKKSEAREKYLDEVEALKDRLNTIEGAESYEASSTRVTEAWHRVIADAESKGFKTIAMVSHGGPLRILFRDILKIGEIENIGDCSCAELEKQGDTVKLLQAQGFMTNFKW